MKLLRWFVLPLRHPCARTSLRRQRCNQIFVRWRLVSVLPVFQRYQSNFRVVYRRWPESAVLELVNIERTAEY